MAGFNLPHTLRQKLGQGQVADEKELGNRILENAKLYEDAVTREELAQFFMDTDVGGPWFSTSLAKTVFRLSEEYWNKEVDAIPIEFLSRALVLMMSRSPVPEKRFVVTLETLYGWKPGVYPDGSPVNPEIPGLATLPSGEDAPTPKKKNPDLQKKKSGKSKKKKSIQRPKPPAPRTSSKKRIRQKTRK